MIHSCRTLADTIVAGWPEDIKDIPKALRPYHNHRNIMTVEDGLILKGEALVIPPLEREKILQGIHEGHHGNHQVPVPCKTVCILAWNQRRYQENG